MADSIKSIKTRQYTNFMGVDFRGGEVPYYHSPDALNMWKDYTDGDCIQTRPGMKLLNTFDNSIFGLFFYKTNSGIQVLVHTGTKLIRWNNYPETPAETTELYTGLNPKKSYSFIYKGVFYFLDGINYVKYDGTTAVSVDGFVPTTSYWQNPDGSEFTFENTDTDTIKQNINCLTPKRRNTFYGDGISNEYHLDTPSLDNNSPVSIEIYDEFTGEKRVLVQGTDFTVNYEKGIITFTEIPNDESRIYVLFNVTIDGLRNRILNCTVFTEFDNRLFASGNPDYPQAIFWCEEGNPEYFAEDGKVEVGIDLAPVKTIIKGNNVLWAIKETGQNDAGVYYLTPTINSVYGKYYVPVSGNVALGCVSKGINFNDDIVYFSRNGLEGINSSSMYSEQILGHRSTYIDAKLLNEENYENLDLCEYQGYLLVLVNHKIYLADKRRKIQTNSGDVEYEWFYWEIPGDIEYITEYQGQLYLGNDNGEIYTMIGDNDNGVDIESYWTTREDDFGYPSYTKTTNKKGAEINFKPMGNNEITVQSIVDKVEKKSQILSDKKGYGVFKMKNKKFFKVQYRISSSKPFGIYSATIQGFIAGYLKR